MITDHDPTPEAMEAHAARLAEALLDAFALAGPEGLKDRPRALERAGKGPAHPGAAEEGADRASNGDRKDQQPMTTPTDDREPALLACELADMLEAAADYLKFSSKPAAETTERWAAIIAKARRTPTPPPVTPAVGEPLEDAGPLVLAIMEAALDHREHRITTLMMRGKVASLLREAAALPRDPVSPGGAQGRDAVLEEYKRAVADRLHYDMNETLEKGRGLRAVRDAGLEEAAVAVNALRSQTARSSPRYDAFNAAIKAIEALKENR